MIHYHGGPITPDECALEVWKGGHAFISFRPEDGGRQPQQLELVAVVAKTFAIDNGAFGAWRRGHPVTDWEPFYSLCREWINYPSCDWAVIPDVIDGTERQNDALLKQWPLDGRGIPVWHLNESKARLKRLASNYPRIALGSTQEYDVASPRKCIQRLNDILPAICHRGQPVVKLHGLRMLNPAVYTEVPLASADSVNIAINIGYDKRWAKGNYLPASRRMRAAVMRDRIESHTAATHLSSYTQP